MATAAPTGGLLGRVKPLDAILATAEKKSLKRTLGWVQLTLLGIGGARHRRHRPQPHRAHARRHPLSEQPHQGAMLREAAAVCGAK